MRMTPRIVARTFDVLAEGPVWHAATGLLYWVDIERGLLHCAEESGANVRTVRFPERIGSFAFREGGGLVVALEHSLSFCETTGEALRQVFANPEPRGTTRFNDGKCDPAGRFWAGTVDLAFRAPLASLYCLDGDLATRRMLPDVCISNGLAWSPDGTAMYFADSATRRVDRHVFDIASGALGERRSSWTRRHTRACLTVRRSAPMAVIGSRCTTAVACWWSVRTGACRTVSRCPWRDRRAAPSVAATAARCSSPALPMTPARATQRWKA